MPPLSWRRRAELVLDWRLSGGGRGKFILRVGTRRSGPPAGPPAPSEDGIAGGEGGKRTGGWGGGVGGSTDGGRGRKGHEPRTKGGR